MSARCLRWADSGCLLSITWPYSILLEALFWVIVFVYWGKHGSSLFCMGSLFPALWSLCLLTQPHEIWQGSVCNLKNSDMHQLCLIHPGENALPVLLLDIRADYASKMLSCVGKSSIKNRTQRVKWEGHLELLETYPKEYRLVQKTPAELQFTKLKTA